MKHIKLLDGIRGFAIIAVMLYHFSISFQHQTDLISLDLFVAKILQSGWLGVDLFFVMSGFLITSILYSSTENKNYFKNFYVRRILRIFPLYYLILCILIFIIPMLSESMNEKTKLLQDNSFWFWMYLVNWRVAFLGGFEHIQAGYMWSLAVEEQFYLIWPIVVKYFKNSLAGICFAAVVLGLILKIYLFTEGYNATTLYVMTFTHLDGLLLGSALAVLYLKKEIDASMLLKFKYIACLSLLICITIFIIEKDFAFYSDLVSLFGISAVSILFCFLLITMLNSGDASTLNKIFSLEPVIYVGKLCYGLYLVHHPIGLFVNEKIISHNSFMIKGSYLPSLFLSILLSGALSILIAHLSYNLFEKHFLNLKKRFI